MVAYGTLGFLLAVCVAGCSEGAVNSEPVAYTLQGIGGRNLSTRMRHLVS